MDPSPSTPPASGPPLASPASGDSSRVEPGIALCLSGGGYRAMVFHLGALCRLNETGLLRTLARVSSVSGGSITAGLLGLRWKKLTFDANGVASNLDALVIAPILALASRTIDEGAILTGLLLPGSVSDQVVSAYKKYVFGDATLQDLPGEGAGPRFVLNATNVQTGALWRFSQPYMGDYLVGLTMAPKVPLALAVAASSAFPPILSPVTMELDPASFTPDPTAALQREPYTRDVVLTDGGVYDNLGLETAWKRCRTILVSDGGLKMSPEPEPKKDWARHAYRINDIIDNQVRSLRKRDLIAAFQAGQDGRDGAYWSIRTPIAEYALPDALPCPDDRVTELAGVATRLKRLEPDIQQRLVNWGYAVCDAALRRHYSAGLPAGVPPPKFPYLGGV